MYLHGAGFGISANLPRIMKLRDEGFSVLAIDYRGFGLSDGELRSEATAYEDAQAAWAELARRIVSTSFTAIRSALPWRWSSRTRRRETRPV